MADSPPLIVPTQGAPYKPSRSAWGGAAVGSILGTPGFGTLLGAAIGYIHGVKKRNRELLAGQKIVNPPAFWNSGAAKGFLLGDLVGGIVAFALWIPFGPIVSAAAGFSCGLIGLIKGGNSRKAEMEQEYAAAERYHAEQAGGRSRAQYRGREPEYDVPERTRGWVQEHAPGREEMARYAERAPAQRSR